MYFVTVSRKLGTGGTEIAKRAAQELGYNFYDGEAIDQTAKKLGFMESFKEADEKMPSFFRRAFSHGQRIAMDRLFSVVYELANQGNAVFLGRGSHFLLRAFECGLHVRITASRETRLRALLGRGYEPGAATAAIDDSDHERGGFIKFAFGLDWDQCELYDIVLNMDKLTVDLAVQIVVTTARSDAMHAWSGNAMRSIEMLGLGYRVEAAIDEAGLAYGPGTNVSVEVKEPGGVLLRGTVDGDATRTRAEEVVKMVPGVQLIDNKIRVKPGDRHA
jgi:cytidylate kinase